MEFTFSIPKWLMMVSIIICPGYVIADTTSQNSQVILRHSSELPVDEATLMIFDTKANGAMKTEGATPQGRIDYQNDNVTGGLFTQGPGKSEIIWPATEHACVLEGEVTIGTLDKNELTTYGPGECWIIEQGALISWEVKSKKFTKSFLTVKSEGVSAAGSLKHVQPEGLWPSAQYHFSHVVTSTGTKTIYLSGQTARDKNGKLVGGSDLEKQMVQALNNVKTGLAAAGASMNDVARIEVYLVDYSSDKLAAYSAAMKQFFDPDHLPANTLLGVESLSFPELLVEVTAIAVLP